MKVENKSSLYFSAYRLKTLEAAIDKSNAAALTLPAKDLLANKAKAMSRVRVSAMVNPYESSNTTQLPSNELQ